MLLNTIQLTYSATIKFSFVKHNLIYLKSIAYSSPSVSPIIAKLANCFDGLTFVFCEQFSHEN